MTYKEINFDDFVVEKVGVWSQICSLCAIKHFKDEIWDEIPINDLICGVENCDNESKYYLDFHEKEQLDT